MNKTYNIAIFEKFPLFGEGLKLLLNKFDSFNVNWLTTDIYHLYEQEVPQTDVLIIDTTHLGVNEIMTLKKIKQILPDTPVVFLIRKSVIFELAINILPKVHGFVLIDGKTCLNELKFAVEMVYAGKNYYPFNVKKMLLKKIKSSKNGSNKTNGLSKREVSVLKLFCGGFTYKEIADKLFISPRTVESHKNNILKKLKIRSTADMIKYAFQHNILN